MGIRLRRKGMIFPATPRYARPQAEQADAELQPLQRQILRVDRQRPADPVQARRRTRANVLWRAPG